MEGYIKKSHGVWFGIWYQDEIGEDGTVKRVQKSRKLAESREPIVQAGVNESSTNVRNVSSKPVRMIRTSSATQSGAAAGFKKASTLAPEYQMEESDGGVIRS